MDRGREEKLVEFRWEMESASLARQKLKNFILSLFYLQNHTAKLPKVVDELFAYWTLENSEDALEELEEALIVSWQ